MKVKRCDNVVWVARTWGSYPNGHVRCEGDQHILVEIQPGDGQSYGLRIERKLARLLAKRMVQCLDET